MRCAELEREASDDKCDAVNYSTKQSAINVKGDKDVIIQ